MTRIPLQECPPSQPRDHRYERDGGVAAAASYCPHQVNDQQMPRPLPQTLQAEISRKTVKKTVPLKLSEYLDSNAFLTTKNSLFVSTSIAVQERVILLTIRDQLSRF